MEYDLADSTFRLQPACNGYVDGAIVPLLLLMLLR